MGNAKQVLSFVLFQLSLIPPSPPISLHTAAWWLFTFFRLAHQLFTARQNLTGLHFLCSIEITLIEDQKQEKDFSFRRCGENIHNLWLLLREQNTQHLPTVKTAGIDSLNFASWHFLLSILPNTAICVEGNNFRNKQVYVMSKAVSLSRSEDGDADNVWLVS